MESDSVSSPQPGRNRTVDRIDAICDAFEKMWLSGQRPNLLESVQSAADSVDRAKLVVELVLLDHEYRLRAGEAADTNSFVTLFPEFEAEIRGAFDAADRDSEPQIASTVKLDGGTQVPDNTLQWESSSEPQSTAPQVANSTSVQIPGYEILELLGRGGMGQVFRARQLEINREVALKLIRVGHSSSDEERIRFQLEAEAVAALEHPNIVHLFDAGETNGQPYLALELVSGKSLDDHMSARSFETPEIVILIETLSRAVHAAHQRGIVHRDLKPDNILFTLDGTPKITDFGIAKRLTERVHETQPGTIMGTPRYMAPEQAGGEGFVGPTTDVYALGVILYELLTNKPVHESKTIWEIIEEIKCREPTPPRAVRPSIPRDLETICLKCLAKKPIQRYQTAEDLAEDLRRFRESRPILARHVGTLERLLLWARRRPLVAGLLSLSLVLVVAMTIGGIWYQQKLQAARVRAERRFDLASQAVDRILSELADENQIVDPGVEQRRSATLREALAFCRALTDEEPDDWDARRRLGFANRRLGDVQRMLGEHQESEQAYQRAIELLSGIPETQADDEVSRQLATAHNFCGELFRVTGRDGDARNEYEKARVLQRTLVDRQNESSDIADLARTHYNIALVDKNASNFDESRDHLRTAAELLNPLIGSPNARSVYRQHMARTKVNLGQALRLLKQPQEAAVAYREAIETLRGLDRRRPNSPDYQFELALALNGYGNVLVSLSKIEGAAKSLGEARDLLQQLSTNYPLVPTYPRELANTFNGLASILASNSQLEEARAAWTEAIKIVKPLVEKDESLVDTRADLGMYMGNLARLNLILGNLDESKSLLEDALPEMAPALSAHPDHPTYRRATWGQCSDLAKIVIRQRQLDQALGTATELDTLFGPRPVSLLVRLVFLDRCLRELDKLEDLAEEDLLRWRESYVEAARPSLQDAMQDPELAETIAENKLLRKIRALTESKDDSTQATTGVEPAKIR